MAASSRWASRSFLKLDDLQGPNRPQSFNFKLMLLKSLTLGWHPLSGQRIIAHFDEYRRVLDKPGTFMMEELLGIQVDIEQSPFQPEKKVEFLKIVAQIKQRAKVMSEEEVNRPLDSGAQMNQLMNWQESYDWVALDKEFFLSMPPLPWQPLGAVRVYKEHEISKSRKLFLRQRKLNKIQRLLAQLCQPKKDN